MSFFANNRQLISELSINTGTTSNPIYSNLCCSSEIGLTTDIEEEDFYVFCDSLKRYVTTGADVGFTATVKLDVQNDAVQEVLSKVHALIKDGTVNQFSNVMIKFSLLSGISGDTLEYTTYTAQANMMVSDLGGAAEEVSEFSIELKLNGKATEAGTSM